MVYCAVIRGYDGIGRHAGFRFLCREACGFESHYPYHEKGSREAAFFNSIRLRRVILLRSGIRLTPSDIGLHPVLRRIEYHCSEGAISLCGIAAKYHIERKRDISLYISKSKPILQEFKVINAVIKVHLFCTP